MRRAHSLRWAAILTLLLPATTLAQDPPAKPKFDLDGDELPVGAIARCGTIRYRHGGEIECVKYSRDGKLLASWGRDGIRLFHAVDGKLLHFWPKGYGLEGVLEFARDNRSLFIADYFALLELDVATGKEIRKLPAKVGLVRSFALGADGMTMAIGGGDGVVLVEVPSGRTNHRFMEPKGQVNAVAWSPDGLTLVGGGEDGVLRFWDIAIGKEQKSTNVGEVIQSLVYSPDGSQIALALGNSTTTSAIRLLDSATGEKKHEFSSMFSWVSHAAAYSPNEKVLAICLKNTIHLCNANDGSLLRKIDLQEDTVHALQFSPDGSSLACTGSGSAIQIFNVKTGECRNSLAGHSASVSAVALMPDGKTIVTGSFDKFVQFWNSDTGKPAASPIETQWRVLALNAASKDSFSTLGSGLTAFDSKTGSVLNRALGAHHLSFRRGTFSQNGRFAAGAYLAKGQFAVFDAATPKRLAEFGRDVGVTETKALAISNDGKLLAEETRSLADPANVPIRIWDIDQRKLLHELAGHHRRIGALEFTPFGRKLVSAGDDGRIRVHDLTTKLTTAEWAVPNDEVITALAISANGRTVASGSENGTIRTWEHLTGQVRRTLPGHFGEVKALRFSADGRLLVSGSADSTALVWRMTPEVSDKSATVQNLDLIWNDLQSGDAVVAERTIWRLASANAATIAALQAKLPRVPMTDGERIKSLIADLNSDKFATRQQAEVNLAKYGAIAQPALQAALDSKLSSEQRDRIKGLLSRLDAIPTGETLGTLRAVEALEHNGSADARRLLDAIAAGSAGSRAAASAKESLERMGPKAQEK